jgi:hypothetical protein
LVGRVLVITGEVSDPQTMEMIRMNCSLHIPRQPARQELWERLRSLLGFSASSPDSAARRSPPTHPSIDSSSS